MKLTDEQAYQIVTAPSRKTELYYARHQESRLVFHCEPMLDINSLSTVHAFTDFLDWVKGFLPIDKFKRFTQLLTAPVETVDSTEIIFDELGKAYDAHDKYMNFEFNNPDAKVDFLNYLATLKENEFWGRKSFECLKTGINDFIVIDVPSRQISAKPEPYFYILSIKDVWDVEINDHDILEYIAYKQDKFTIIVIDDLAYRVYWMGPNNNEDWKIKDRFPHDLNYTPACSFYTQSIKGSARINKRGPITACLTKLDWLLFWKTSKKYLDLYGAYPIIVTYKETCHYKDEYDNECDGYGYINYDVEQPNGGFKRAQKACPECAKRSMIGPGSEWSVDAPADSSDVDLLKNPVAIVEVSNDKLEYGVKEIERLENEIYLNTVGFDGDAINKQSLNEDQVHAGFESRRAVLNRIKLELEKCRKFGIDTMARIRYGEQFLHSNVSFGTEFFLKSADQVAKEYSEAKAAGLPMFELANVREIYIKTRFKENPQAYDRARILSMLEPYPDMTLGELFSLQYNYLDPWGFELKLNFSNFVSKFERENNTNILDFGSLIPLAQKINIITQKLYDYVQNSRASKTPIAQPVSGSVSSTTRATIGGGTH